MTEHAIYLKSQDEYTPISFLPISEDEKFDILYDSNLLDIRFVDKETEQTWKDLFIKINEGLNTETCSYTTRNFSEDQILKELNKTLECVGNTIVYTLDHLYEKDWLGRISEYMLYMDYCIASCPGTIIYWMVMEGFLEEDGIPRPKAKQALESIQNREQIIHSHKYFNELNTLREFFPFKVLDVQLYRIPNIIRLLELYPNGKLNRFIAHHFPEVPKKLSRKIFSKLIHKDIKETLGEYSTEELWKGGDANAIKEFLIESTILESKITSKEILQSFKSEYPKTIKSWLNTQTLLINKLNEIEKLQFTSRENTRESAKEPNTSHHAKYYALYQRIFTKLGKAEPFLKNENDRFPKAEIITFANKRFPGISAQQFYTYYRDLEDMSDKTTIARSYPKLKKIVAEISNNDADVLHYLKEFPG